MVGAGIKFSGSKRAELMTPFECGFDPNHGLRMPFSMRFFLVRLAFLVFDIEIALILPIPLLLFSGSVGFIFCFVGLLLLLLLGAIFEWNQGSLE